MNTNQKLPNEPNLPFKLPLHSNVLRQPAMKHIPKTNPFFAPKLCRDKIHLSCSIEENEPAFQQCRSCDIAKQLRTVLSKQ